MTKTLFVLSLIIIWANASIAQDKSIWDQPIPLKLSIADETIGFPNFWFTRYGFNPVLMIGSEVILKERNNHNWHLTGNLGYYHHKGWQSAVFVSSEIAYRQYIGRLFSVSPKFGLGYSHVFANKPVYRLNHDEWEQVTDYGSPTFNVSLAVELELKLKPEASSPAIFMNYQSMVDIPFNVYTGMHHFVGVGYKFYPFKKHSS